MIPNLVIQAYKPGDKVWYWQISARPPVEVTIDSVCIWMEKTSISISYSIERTPLVPNLGGRIENVFATYDEAVRFKNNVLTTMHSLWQSTIWRH